MHAPTIVVQGFGVNRKTVILAAFAPPPLTVVLPLKMLAPHDARSCRHSTPAARLSTAGGGSGATASSADGGRSSSSSSVGLLDADAGADAPCMAVDLDAAAASAGLCPVAEGGTAEVTAAAAATAATAAAGHAAAAATWTPRRAPAFDEHGTPLLDCNRGTDDTEIAHKEIVASLGTWFTGVEMAD